MKKKRCLIFGANGFIARSFANNLKIKDRFNIIKFPKKKLNLLNKNCILLLNKFIKKGDYILFLAAEAPCKNLDQLEKNVKMITNFLSVVKYKDISYLSYVSSDAVYSDSKKPITEKSKTNPSSFYGHMHLLREKFLQNTISKDSNQVLLEVLREGIIENNKGVDCINRLIELDCFSAFYHLQLT